MVYSGAWGKLIHEKNQKSKIFWHCPFNDFYALLLKSVRSAKTEKERQITVGLDFYKLLIYVNNA